MDTFISETSRRDFLKTLGTAFAGLTIVGFVAPVINGCSSSTDPGADVDSFDITVDVSSLTADNMGLRTNTPDGHTLLVVRNSATSYTSLLLVCTHQGCSGNDLQQSGTTVNCSCHGSKYNLSGGVVQGPATKSLTTYPTTYDASKKTVNIKSS